MTGLKFSKDIYCKQAILSAAFRFTDKAYIHLDSDGEYYFVNVEMKSDNCQIREKDFINEVLTQMVRIEVSDKTKNIRELIIARALSSTLIYEEPDIEPQCSNVNKNDILTDWFENNGNTEN